ncbi:hypothetical protein B0H14DRAFT_3478070 [Mycena olivaceomarginata]|nr:hypothetical protein B0H14DRAFT_3478070 [Mycena olivaceomarginata]
MPATAARRRRTLLGLLFAHLLQLIAYAALIYQEAMMPSDPILYHTSALSGQQWFGVRHHIFNILMQSFAG